MMVMWLLIVVNSGVISWKIAPTSTGTLAIMPAATGPRPKARAKAGM